MSGNSELKICSACKAEKPVSDFHKQNRPGRRNGYCQAQCKECAKRYQADWWRKKLYGLEPGVFEDMLAAQNGVCAICGSADATCVDHDHETGNIRGILCSPCNKALGFAKDSPGVLRAAAQYLERSRGQFPDS